MSAPGFDREEKAHWRFQLVKPAAFYSAWIRRPLPSDGA